MVYMQKQFGGLFDSHICILHLCNTPGKLLELCPSSFLQDLFHCRQLQLDLIHHIPRLCHRACLLPFPQWTSSALHHPSNVLDQEVSRILQNNCITTVALPSSILFILIYQFKMFFTHPSTLKGPKAAYMDSSPVFFSVSRMDGC